MWMVAADRQTHGPSRFDLWVGGHLAPSLHSSDEAGELSNGHGHDESTMLLLDCITAIAVARCKRGDLQVPIVISAAGHSTWLTRSLCHSWTIRVQNCAGSGIKRGSCWKCSSGWHAICLRYSYNCRTTFQLTLRVARVSRRQLSFLCNMQCMLLSSVKHSSVCTYSSHEARSLHSLLFIAAVVCLVESAVPAADDAYNQFVEVHYSLWSLSGCLSACCIPCVED